MLKEWMMRWIEPEVTRRVKLALAETDNTITVGWRSSANERDRLDYDREQVLELALT